MSLATKLPVPCLLNTENCCRSNDTEASIGNQYQQNQPKKYRHYLTDSLPPLGCLCKKSSAPGNRVTSGLEHAVRALRKRYTPRSQRKTDHQHYPCVVLECAYRASPSNDNSPGKSDFLSWRKIAIALIGRSQ